MGVYDIELIYSWTPREFRNLLRGAQLRDVDGREKDARLAMAIGYAQNAGKKAREKRIYDAKKARRLIKQGREGWQDAKERDMENIKRLKDSLKDFNPAEHFKEGGSA